jgi:hypothetical protein
LHEVYTIQRTIDIAHSEEPMSESTSSRGALAPALGMDPLGGLGGVGVEMSESRVALEMTIWTKYTRR